MTEEKTLLKSEEEILACKKTLNEEQSKVFDDLIAYIKGETDANYFSVIGYAGTGKTYMMSKVVQATKCKVAMTAPTNKAVKVLMDNRTDMDSRVQYITIHKLLALKMQWVYPKGKDKFQPYQKLVPNRYAEKTLNHYDLIIVDEVSMLDDELFIMLDDERLNRVKVIFMGDPAQIPPVNREDAIPLVERKREIYKIEARFLETIMRQAKDSKILETAYQIRNNRFQQGDAILSRQSSKDVLFLSPASVYDTKVLFEEIKLHFADEQFSKDPNYCKVIAWTNETVNNMNTWIRQQLFKRTNLEQILPGEKLIADKPIIKNQVIIYNTSDEFEVVSCTRKVFNYTIPDKKSSYDWDDEDDAPAQGTLKGFEVIKVEPKQKSFTLNYWEAVVKSKDPITKDEYTNTIDILDEDSAQQLSWCLGGLYKKKLFKEYTEMSERFGKVKYNYAITAHKSQGSTYGTVFLMEDDINKNQKTLEKNRIKYTACTRPKKRLFIYSSRNKPFKEQFK